MSESDQGVLIGYDLALPGKDFTCVVLRKGKFVIAHAVIDGRCHIDGQTCTHDCVGDECWRELDGS